MENKLCPLKIELTNDRYYCIGKDCAWWVMFSKEGICAITQLAVEINCNTREV